MKKSKLSKKNWTQLNEFGLVVGRNNGFASTTPKADKIGFSKKEKFLKQRVIIPYFQFHFMMAVFSPCGML